MIRPRCLLLLNGAPSRVFTATPIEATNGEAARNARSVRSIVRPITVTPTVRPSATICFPHSGMLLGGVALQLKPCRGRSSISIEDFTVVVISGWMVQRRCYSIDAEDEILAKISAPVAPSLLTQEEKMDISISTVGAATGQQQRHWDYRYGRALSFVRGSARPEPLCH